MSRAAPSFRIAEGDAYDHAVARGGRLAYNTPTQERVTTWGPAPIWSPTLGLYQWSHSKRDVAGTTVASIGGGAPTIATPGGAATSVETADISSIRYATAASLGSECGWTGVDNERRRHNPMLFGSVMLQNLIDQRRDFVGWTSSSAILSGTTALHAMGFLHEHTGAASPWKAIVAGGASLTVQASLPANAALDTRYNFLVVAREGFVEFWYSLGRLRNGQAMTLLSVAGSNLPGIDTAIAALAATRTLAAATKQLAIGRLAGSRE